MSTLFVLTAYAWVVVFAGVVTVALTLYGLARQREMAPSSDAPPVSSGDAPPVSVLVPARNEEHRVLRESLRSILAQDYENFEVVVVNDRSTDATGAVLDSLAGTDARLRIIEGTELPAGWLGKPHAMRQAFDVARGSWVLATDADMLFAPAALRTAMAYALASGVDALTLIPHFESGSFWERVVIPAWAWVLLIVSVFYRVNDARSPRAMGIGGFFLVRAEALRRVGGYEKLRDEVAEDFRLAEMLKRSGAAFRLEFAPRLLRTRMYTNFREMYECHSKNWFAGVGYSMVMASGSFLLMYAVGVAPPVIAAACLIGAALGYAALWQLFVPCALAWVMQVFVIALFNRRFKVPLLYALLTPLGLALLYGLLLDSGLKISLGRGVTWKGRKIYEREGVRPPRPGFRSD